MNSRIHRLALVALSSVTGLVLSAQEQEEVTIDMLKAPASPASNMLGIAAEEIQRPTDLTSFMVSLRQASGDFTQLPVNYALDLAPCWLFPGKGKHGSMSSLVLRDTTDDGVREQGTTGLGRVWQSLVVSTAVANLGAEEGATQMENTKAGFGLKLSLVTPKVDSASGAAFNSFRALLRGTVELDAAYVDSVLNTDPVYAESGDSVQALTAQLSSLRAQRDQVDAFRLAHLDAPQRSRDSLNVVSEMLSREIAFAGAARNLYRDRQRARKGEMTDVLNRDAHEARTRELEEAGSNLAINRKGFFLDLSAGLAIEFVDRDFGNGQFRKGGAWFSSGYTCPGFTATGMGRTLFGTPVEVLKEDSSLVIEDPIDMDIGLNLAYDKSGRRFTFSGELLWRFTKLGDEKSDTYRLMTNAAYAFDENKKLTFSFGRNFDGTTTKGGNLVAALNLLLGFGGSKKVDAPTDR